MQNFAKMTAKKINNIFDFHPLSTPERPTMGMILDINNVILKKDDEDELVLVIEIKTYDDYRDYSATIEEVLDYSKRDHGLFCTVKHKIIDLYRKKYDKEGSDCAQGQILTKKTAKYHKFTADWKYSYLVCSFKFSLETRYRYLQDTPVCFDFTHLANIREDEIILQKSTTDISSGVYIERKTFYGNSFNNVYRYSDDYHKVVPQLYSLSEVNKILKSANTPPGIKNHHFIRASRVHFKTSNRYSNGYFIKFHKNHIKTTRGYSFDSAALYHYGECPSKRSQGSDQFDGFVNCNYLYNTLKMEDCVGFMLCGITKVIRIRENIFKDFVKIKNNQIYFKMSSMFDKEELSMNYIGMYILFE